MKKLILTLFSVALVAWALYAPPEATCQVGAPCSPGQSSISLAAPDAPSIAQSDERTKTADLTSILTDYDKSVEYTWTVDYPASSALTDVTETITGGGLPSGIATVSYDCGMYYADACAPADAASITVSGIRSDCGRTGTTGTATQEWTMGTVAVPGMECNNPTVAVPAPPNDTIDITLGDLLSSGTGGDGFSLAIAAGAGAYWPSEAVDGCSVSYGTLVEQSSTVVETLDADWITNVLEGTVAAGATGLCCVTETAYQTPAQSGCIYQGGGIGPLEINVLGSKCSFAASTGEVTGAGATDLCSVSYTIVDSNNVCPFDWCTLNPGDPNCGGGPD